MHDKQLISIYWAVTKGREEERCGPTHKFTITSFFWFLMFLSTLWTRHWVDVTELFVFFDQEEKIKSLSTLVQPASMPYISDSRSLRSC